MMLSVLSLIPWWGWLLSAAVGVPFCFVRLLLWYYGKKLPRNSPAAVNNASDGSPATRPRVCCLGDSITHGRVSHCYVDELARRDRTRDFVNGGVNSELAWNVSQRLGEVVLTGPQFVTIMIGTNDIKSLFADEFRAHTMSTQRPPQVPSLSFYLSSYRLMLQKLLRHTKAQLLVLSIPLLGEDLSEKGAPVAVSGLHYDGKPVPRDRRSYLGNANDLVREWNTALEQLVASMREEDEDGAAARLSYRDIHTPQLERLRRLRVRHGGTDQTFHAFLPLLSKALLRRVFCCLSWDRIARAHGRHMMPDGLHLSERGTKDIVEAITDWLAREGRPVRPQQQRGQQQKPVGSSAGLRRSRRLRSSSPGF